MIRVLAVIAMSPLIGLAAEPLRLSSLFTDNLIITYNIKDNGNVFLGSNIVIHCYWD